jgi:hypothetical protein
MAIGHYAKYVVTPQHTASVGFCHLPAKIMPIDCANPRAVKDTEVVPATTATARIRPSWADPLAAGLAAVALLSFVGVLAVVVRETHRR